MRGHRPHQSGYLCCLGLARLTREASAQGAHRHGYLHRHTRLLSLSLRGPQCAPLSRLVSRSALLHDGLGLGKPGVERTWFHFKFFYQTLNGHAMTATFLKEKWGLVDSDMCWWCSKCRQNREHLFKECLTWKKEIRLYETW